MLGYKFYGIVLTCIVAAVTGHKGVKYFKADDAKRKDFEAF